MFGNSLSPLVQFSSIAQSCLILCNPMDCSTPGFPIRHQLPELTQTHVHGVGDAIRPSHPLSSPSPPAFNLSQHQGLFQWVGSSHHVAKVLEPQLQHQSFQQIFRDDFLYFSSNWLWQYPNFVESLEVISFNIHLELFIIPYSHFPYPILYIFSDLLKYTSTH